MIVQKCPPALGRRLGVTCHVFGHRCLRDLKTELEQFAMDPWWAPTCIGVYILRMSFRSSLSMLGRPMGRLFLVQYRRKPSRCHRTTVSGCKATSIFRQPLTKRAKTIQKKRSPRIGQIRFERDFIIGSRCRRARFSKASSCRDRQHDRNHRTSKVAHISMRRMLPP